MNGFSDHGLDEGAFAEKSSLKGGLQTFDAFRKSFFFDPRQLDRNPYPVFLLNTKPWTTNAAKTKPSYTTPSRRGGQWTILILVICTVFSLTEFRTWLKGTEAHHFTVEKGVSHDLQLNLDAVVRMPCDDLHINIQDAAGDRVLASEMLKREPTSWKLWMDKRNYEGFAGGKEYQTLSREDEGRLAAQEEDAHASHVLSELRRNPNKKFPKGPKLRWGEQVDSCRIYGSLEGNKVQGDFHITARGHGYGDGMKHLDHSGTPFQTYTPFGTKDITNWNSIQLLAHDNRTLVRPSLPNHPQPARQNNRNYGNPLLQIPILPLHRSNHLLTQPKNPAGQTPLLPRPRPPKAQQEPHLHKPVCGDLGI